MCYTKRGTSSHTQLNYNRGDYDLLRALLRDVDWAVLHDSKVLHSYHSFMSTLKAAVATSVPEARPKVSKNLYINRHARKLKQEKVSLWNIYTHTQYAMEYARYCRCRSRLRKLTRGLRSIFEHRLSRDLKHNPKAFQRYSNSRLKTKVGIDSLIDEHWQLTRDDEEKASILNRYFSSVFTKEDVSTLPSSSPSEHSARLCDLMVTPEMVKLKLKHLKSSSSPGPDKIHPRVLVEAAEQLAEPLSIIYNKSIQSGCLPDDWKLGTVVPILKKGNRQEPENYCPVSLTAIPCKVLESLIRDHLLAYLEENQLLSQHQNGFRSQRSCTTQLLEVIDEWTLCIEKATL